MPPSEPKSELNMPFIFPNPTDEIPGIGNPELAKRGFEDWIEKVGQPLADETAKNPAVHKLLSAIFGNSPFLTFCILKESEFFLLLLRHGPDVAYAHISDILSNNSKQTLNDADLSRLLRVCKRQVALLTASADISGVWPLEKITQTLSEFAGTALSLASSHLLRQLASKGAFTLKNTENPEVGSGLVILGMGKLGAFELNYSSDIDLIVLYDPECIDTEHPEAIQNHFVRLARGLIKLIDERTADGYVFRTDLRLRPDPSATPLAVSVLAAETYYESLGQNWERAAMIKARPVAGDIEAGERFLKWLTPFIWRKNLDFAAIQDIHSIKRQINAHRGGSEIAIAGHNVKLGAGGIREVEFFEIGRAHV